MKISSGSGNGSSSSGSGSDKSTTTPTTTKLIPQTCNLHEVAPSINNHLEVSVCMCVYVCVDDTHTNIIPSSLSLHINIKSNKICFDMNAGDALGKCCSIYIYVCVL